ncbi:hypothetical protein PL75_03065 [Neisseria arctica]|uniref:Uncharacterized protein n=1 Tax=Neisseria arctica TaxID=1470200 RepID=A0A0J0YSY9_9NEIS|nr:hypothetical protein [Neisseria arctica]KLT73229.1 hypothetical protein PL75_03065 [Neisseria arctica]UOO87526.1 hypothetical protein LVJ86_04580 [Neisseria arctica]
MLSNASRKAVEVIAGDVEAGARAKADGFYYQSTEQSLRQSAEQERKDSLVKAPAASADNAPAQEKPSLSDKINMLKSAAASDSITFTQTINTLGDNQAGKEMMQRADEAIKYKQQIQLQQDAQRQEMNHGMSISR